MRQVMLYIVQVRDSFFKLSGSVSNIRSNGDLDFGCVLIGEVYEEGLGSNVVHSCFGEYWLASYSLSIAPYLPLLTHS